MPSSTSTIKMLSILSWKVFLVHTFLLLIMSWGINSKLDAQVSFVWPDSTRDIATYSTVEECLVALRRIHRLDLRGKPEVNFELPASYAVDTFSSLFARTARECSDKFTVDDLFLRDSVHISAMQNAYALLILSGRNSDARTFGDRWLASISSENDTLRSVVLSTLVSVALTARPILFDEAWVRIEQLDIKKFWKYAVYQAGNLFLTAVGVLDTGNAYRAARWLSEIPDSVGEEVTQTTAWQHPQTGAGQTIYSAIQYLEQQRLIDSLRKSTDAYVSYLNLLRKLSKLNNAVELDLAKPLTADFWFPDQPSTPIPQPRKVSVIVTTGDNDCNACLGGVAMVRRLSDLFPSVSFTLLAQTRGYHGLVIKPPDPDIEASLIDSIYRSIHGFPGTVGVSKTEFWRIEGLDRRRMNQDTPNEETYPTKNMDATASNQIYLIDRDSRIVLKRAWKDRKSENEIRLFLDAITNQLQQ